MTYIVNEKCIKCKYTDCVEVCPVDCFYARHAPSSPQTNASIAEARSRCLVDAIKPDTEPGLEKRLELNRKFSESGRTSPPRSAMPHADAHKDGKTRVPEVFFTTEPGRQLGGRDATRRKMHLFRTLFRTLTIGPDRKGAQTVPQGCPSFSVKFMLRSPPTPPPKPKFQNIVKNCFAA